MGKKKKKLIEWKVSDDLFSNLLSDVGVDIISLVSEPAIEEGFIYFADNKYKNLTLARIDEEQHIVVGPAMIPDKEIYRFDEKTGEEYYGVFSADTIKKCGEIFMAKSANYNTSIEHSKATKNTFLTELWYIEDENNDKANALGYKLPKGTMMTAFKVNDPELWVDIKNGKIKGFSIEGRFAEELLKASSTENIEDIIYNKLTEILKPYII